MITIWHYYYGARYYSGRESIWLGVDPMSDKYPGLSPFAYCANNPIMLIDPDGRDWAEVETGSGKDLKKEIQWFDSKKAFEKSGQKGTYLGKAAVVFNGSRDEKLGNGDNMYGDGAKLASVTVYGPANKDDISQYDGFTMSSDASSFGVIANGDYNVNRVNDKGPYNSEWAVNNRSSVPALDGINPAHPD